MYRWFKTLLCMTISLVCVLCTAAVSVSADEADGRKMVVSDGVSEAYTYSKVGGGTKVISSPDTYLPRYVVDTDSLGVELLNPSHITTHDNKLYIVNTGKNNIIITDEEFNVIHIIDSFENDGVNDTFASPRGCFVTEQGEIYVADTDNHRIVVIGSDYKLLQIILTPESDVLASDFVFKPQKIVVDSSKRIFVVADGVYEGIMQFYEDGSFIGFVGSIPVTASPLEIMWKKLLSKEQNSKLAQFVPVSYTNIFLDAEEFMYTVSLSSTLTDPIRRLNPGGSDILIRNALADTTVAGDQIGKISQFVAVCSDINNTYYVADSERSRIFIYDEDGNLLCVFGGSYTGQIGTYKQISSLLLFNNDLLVVDAQASMITALYPTDYMLSIKAGLDTYRTGRYEESYEKWQQALEFNSNFDLAYSKIGMIEIRNKNYSDAMENFKLANDQENYSKAYKKYRSEWYTANLSYVITGILVIVVCILTFRFIRKRRAKKNA